MPKGDPNRKQGIREMLLDGVERKDEGVVRKTARAFSISRQAVHKHMRDLIDEGFVTESGVRRSKKYGLKVIAEQEFFFKLPAPEEPKLEEHIIWRDSIRPLLSEMPINVIDVAEYSVTEMLNNAIDHSDGKNLLVTFERTARFVSLKISDDGIGVFQKIQRAFNLTNEQESVLELTKGKLTTAPKAHSGEGIFFTSRMCDRFSLLSGTTALLVATKKNWVIETPKENVTPGTFVELRIRMDSPPSKDTFDKFSIDEGFDRTTIPIALAKYSDGNFVSRSQAKRVTSRFERFKEVLLDFAGVETIGQAFADEIFRVFPLVHPDVKLIPINMNANVARFVARARIAAGENRGPDATDQLELPISNKE